jgi:glucosyl-3-phosphoglycerate synthase
MRVALLVPAKNEATVISPTLTVMTEVLQAGIVHEAVVLDNGSTDNTADLARDAEVRCISSETLCPECGPVLGKGDSLWRGLHAVLADVYVFLDADLGNVAAHHVDALIDPLRGNDNVMFVKSGFERIDENGLLREKAAGRVTEEVGRPLAAVEHPRLAELSQPLSGQVAIRANALAGMSLATGYGLEIAMLIDMWRTFGTDGLVEVNWGQLFNRWKPDEALVEVRDQVLAGASLRGVTLPEFGVRHDPFVVDRKY